MGLGLVGNSDPVAFKKRYFHVLSNQVGGFVSNVLFVNFQPRKLGEDSNLL